MSVLKLDEKGRLTVPKAYRRDLGRKVLIINAGDHLKVIPIPADPVRALRGVLSVKKSFKMLRKEAENLAEKEIRARGQFKDCRSLRMMRSSHT